MKNILLIYNPKAGDTTFRFSLDRFIEIFSEKGYEVRVFRSRVPGDMAEYIQQKQMGQTEAIMVAGGTGTVNEVVAAMLEQKIDLPLGIVPAGTENEYARCLGFEGELEENLKALFAMEETRVDVGKAGDRYFVDCCSAGTFSSVTAVSNDVRNAFGKMAGYMKGAISFKKLKPMKLQIEADGKRYTGVFACFILANEAIRKNGHLSTGKFTLIATKGNQLGGEAKYLEKDYPIGQTIIRKGVVCAEDGIGEVEKGVLRLSSDHFDIRVLESEIPVQTQIDGEWGPDLPLEVTILPQALRVFYNPVERQAHFARKEKARLPEIQPSKMFHVEHSDKTEKKEKKKAHKEKKEKKSKKDKEEVTEEKNVPRGTSPQELTEG